VVVVEAVVLVQNVHYSSAEATLGVLGVALHKEDDAVVFEQVLDSGAHVGHLALPLDSLLLVLHLHEVGLDVESLQAISAASRESFEEEDGNLLQLAHQVLRQGLGVYGHELHPLLPQTQDHLRGELVSRLGD